MNKILAKHIWKKETFNTQIQFIHFHLFVSFLLVALSISVGYFYLGLVWFREMLIVMYAIFNRFPTSLACLANKTAEEEFEAVPNTNCCNQTTFVNLLL